MRREIAKTGWVWGSALALASVLFVACGAGSSRGSSAQPSSLSSTSPTTAVAEDAKLSAADFRNVNTMTRVGDHFVANVRGHLAQALAVAHSAKGGRYPVGTILQLVPQEAMVKRAPGYNPSTNDWEFFSLDVSASGTRILSRGGAAVLNRFGGSCASCHSAAASRFDLVCGTTHGCAPLPVGPDVFASLQRADPRPLH
jgi:mono/diheme cytochrome c family protein